MNNSFCKYGDLLKKMKKILSVLTVFVIVSMLLACRPLSIRSGDEGGGGDQKTVALDFDLTLSDEIAKSISANPDPNYYDDVEFWYRAIPQNIPGDVSGDTSKAAGKDENSFVKLTFMNGTQQIPASMDNTSGTVGYFTEGQWAFDIEVRKPLEDSSYAVLWKTSSSVVKTVNNNNKNIAFILSKNIDPSITGTVIFDVTALKVSDTDFFEVYYSDIDSQKREYKIEGLIQGQDGSQSTLTGSTELNSGLYNLWVDYYSAEGAWIGTGMTALEVLPGGVVTVSGTIDAEQVTVDVFFNIKGMYKLSVEVDATGDIEKEDDIYTVVAGDGTVNFTCIPTVTELDGSTADPEPDCSYEWRIKGETVSSDASFDWQPGPDDANQDVYVDCIVSIKNGQTVIGAGCATLKFKVIK